MSLYKFIFEAHSGTRWLLLLIGVFALVKLLITWLGSKEFGRVDGFLTRSFLSLFDIQFLLGLTLLIMIWSQAGSIATYQIEHAGTSFVALIVAHIAAKWKRSPGPIRARNTIFVFLLAIALVVVAIMRLPQGWG